MKILSLLLFLVLKCALCDVLSLGDGGSKEWIQRLPFAEGSTIIYTWTNFAMKDFLFNFIMNLKRLGITNFVVGALDQPTFDYMEEVAGRLDMRIPVLNLHSNLTTGDYGWNSHSFKLMAKYKFESVCHLLEAGYESWVFDTDVAILENPLDYGKRFPVPDILISTDTLRRAPLNQQIHSTLNIGMMLLRPKSAKFVRNFYQTMIEHPEFGKGLWDQGLWNDMVRKEARHSSDDYLTMNDGLKIQALDILDFSNGQVFFVQKLHEKLNHKTIAVHATFQFGGSVGKRHRYREAMIWHDEEAYYDVPVLSYTNEIPADLLAKSSYSVEDHFELMNFQIVQLRNAWAIGRSLGRRLVLPELFSGFDRAWFTSFLGNGSGTGVFPGSDPLFTLPIRGIPADHVLDFEMLDKLHLMDELREYSFLQNSRTPKHMIDDVIYAGFKSRDVDITLKSFSSSDDLKKQLASRNMHKRLHLRDVPIYAFSKFSDSTEQNAFHELMRTLGGIWCCAKSHVWYDMLYPQYPHRDRHGRMYKQWEIRYGDN